MSRIRVKEMTSGNPAKLLFFFALPLMAGNIFQQLYSVVDTIIVGRGVGVGALASLGASDWFNWLVLGVVIGFAQGFGIQMAQEFGARDYEHLRRTVRDSAVLLAVLTILLIAVSQLLVVPVLRFLRTPENIFAGAEIYLRIIYGGLLFTAFYNLLASALRSLGDSRTPLTSMIVASVVNILLDSLFVFVFHWGIAGAAIATILSQGLAGWICLAQIRRIDVLQGDEVFALPSLHSAQTLLKLGLPMAFQNFIIAAGGMVLQTVVNGFGFLFIAGYTATNKLYGVIEMAAVSYGFAVTTFVGQNYGAEDLRRIRKGVFAGCLISLVTAVGVCVVMVLCGRTVLSFFISNENPSDKAQALDVAYRYLFVMCVCSPMLYLLYVYRSALQGLGDTVLPMVSGGVELSMRVGTVLLLRGLWGEYAVYAAEAAAWIGAAVMLWISYQLRMKRLERQGRFKSSVKES